MTDLRQDRLPLVDALKAIACQLIVLHHLAFYGPMSDRAEVLAPALVAGLSQHGRLAVQVFLVVAGFLAARALAPEGQLRTTAPLATVFRRYIRLALPYFAAIAIAIPAAAAARSLMDHDSVPAAPTAAQLAVHALLLQDVLGFESLSAGFWYVAIDFQLFALLVAVLWIGTRVGGQRAGSAWIGPMLVAVLGCASLFFFNRVAALDAWAPYFLASYAMGAIAYWITRGRGVAVLWLLPLVLVTLAALALDFRIRIALALGVALVLAGGARGWMPTAWAEAPAFSKLASISYSVFLVHFPVCLMVSGVWTRFLPADPWVHALGVVVAWGASVATGALVYRHVESRGAIVLARLAAAARRVTPPAPAGLAARERSTPRQRA
jgi:peptidoglycan/LPS O-acetylase OafA/YrhL